MLASPLLVAGMAFYGLLLHALRTEAGCHQPSRASGFGQFTCPFSVHPESITAVMGIQKEHDV